MMVQVNKKEYDRKRYLSKPEYFKEISSVWRNKNIEWFMFNSAKHRAERKNIPFELERKDIVIPEVCPILGCKLENSNSSYSNKDCSPSLDRKDPKLGYTKENIWVISNKANTMKSNASVEELKKFAEWVNSL